jgi:hypothetical protein
MNNLTHFQRVGSNSTNDLPSETLVSSRESLQEAAALVSACFPSVPQQVVLSAVDGALSSRRQSIIQSVSGSQDFVQTGLMGNDGIVPLCGGTDPSNYAHVATYGSKGRRGPCGYNQLPNSSRESTTSDRYRTGTTLLVALLIVDISRSVFL